MTLDVMGGVRALSELKEYAGLSAGAQRYIRQALDVALDRQDAIAYRRQNQSEAKFIARQQLVYARLPAIRRALPAEQGEQGNRFLGSLMSVSSFDLSQGELDSFGAYRFLYERLFGAAIRCWLPGVFCGAASLPQVPPRLRAVLLKSISEAAVTATAWSDREAVFFPDWHDGDERALG